MSIRKIVGTLLLGLTTFYGCALQGLDTAQSSCSVSHEQLPSASWYEFRSSHNLVIKFQDEFAREDHVVVLPLTKVLMADEEEINTITNTDFLPQSKNIDEFITGLDKVIQCVTYETVVGEKNERSTMCYLEIPEPYNKICFFLYDTHISIREAYIVGNHAKE